MEEIDTIICLRKNKQILKEHQKNYGEVKKINIRLKNQSVLIKQILKHHIVKGAFNINNVSILPVCIKLTQINVFVKIS